MLSASGAVGDQIRVRILATDVSLAPARSQFDPQRATGSNRGVLAAVVSGEDGAGARTPEVLGGRTGDTFQRNRSRFSPRKVPPAIDIKGFPHSLLSCWSQVRVLPGSPFQRSETR